MLSKIKAFFAAHPVAKHAIVAFVAAAVPLIAAAVYTNGGVTRAVVFSAIIAGLHAAYHSFVAPPSAS